MTEDIFNALGAGLNGMPSMEDDSEKNVIDPEE